MAIADLPMPVDFCAWSAAIYDVATHKAVAGAGKGYASDSQVSFEPSPEFVGGDEETVENGCGAAHYSRIRPECLKWIRGDFVVGRAHPEWDALQTGAGLYVAPSGDYSGKTIGGSGLPDTCGRNYVWLTMYSALDIDDARSGITSPNQWRIRFFPKCEMRPRHGGPKKGPHAFKYDIIAYPDRVPDLAAASSASGTTTNSSTNVTVASTVGLSAGQAVSGTGIPVGATIQSITNSTTFVLSAAATASGTATLTFARLASSYTGPFGELPATFWTQITQTAAEYWLDVPSLPTVDTLRLITAA